MSKEYHEYYPTLTDGQRKLLYCKVRQRYKSSRVLGRLLRKETRSLGRIMVRKRILRYRQSLDPRGEPMYSRKAPWKCVIKTNDIAYLLGICERYAQKKHKILKDELGKEYVTVKEFCKSEKLDEEYVQCLLNDGDALRLNSGKFRKMIEELNRRHEQEIRAVMEAARKEEEAEEKIKRAIGIKVEKLAVKDDKTKKVSNVKTEKPADKENKKEKNILPKKRSKSLGGPDE